MKKFLFAIGTIGIMASCSNDTPRTAAETKVVTPTDTAGLAQYQAWKAQNELAATNQVAQNNLATTQPAKEVVKQRVVYVNKPAPRKTSTKRSTSSAGNGNNNGVSNSNSNNTASAKKKGWSKAAKGAAIGGASGAVIGAVVNKRNRAAGGVIGGVLGAGVGYGVGRSKDKKDGRY